MGFTKGLPRASWGFFFRDYISFLHLRFPGRFKAQARLYGPDMPNFELEARFPMIVQVPNHFVVALAIGRKPGFYDRILWWDPADGRAHNATVGEFFQYYGGESFLFASRL